MIESPSGAQWWSPFRKRACRSALAELVAGVLAVVVIAPSPRPHREPGPRPRSTRASWNAIVYIDTQQNLNGSYGVSVPVTETGMGLVAYSVLANGDA